MTRQEANLAILSHLTDLVNRNPDLRFFQLLDLAGAHEVQLDSTGFFSIGYKDKFYEESEVTLERMKNDKV